MVQIGYESALLGYAGFVDEDTEIVEMTVTVEDDVGVEYFSKTIAGTEEVYRGALHAQPPSGTSVHQCTTATNSAAKTAQGCSPDIVWDTEPPTVFNMEIWNTRWGRYLQPPCGWDLQAGELADMHRSAGGTATNNFDESFELLRENCAPILTNSSTELDFWFTMGDLPHTSLTPIAQAKWAILGSKVDPLTPDFEDSGSPNSVEGLTGKDEAAATQTVFTVRKKGLDTILQALAQLPDELDWHWHHAGGGELLADLKAEADRLGIASRITWHGSQPRDVIRDLYNQADLFLIASRITGNGDRDGLPNVLMEAASFIVPAIGTRVGALPEFIEHDVSGWLIAPDDASAMAAAISGLAADRARLERYGRAAALRLQTGFAFNHCLDPLVNLLQAVRETKADTGSTTIADLPSK